MKTFNKIYLIVIALVFIWACSQSEDGESEHLNTSEINLSNLSKFPPDFSLINRIEYIPLHTSDESMLGSICKIIFKKDRFYIFDDIQNIIFVLNKKGGFEYKIQNKGKGPSEYININAFDVDKNGNIHIYDNMLNKILIYSDNGNKCQNITMDIHFEEFALLDGAYLLRNVYEKGEVICRLGFYNPKSEKLEMLIDNNLYPDDFGLTRYNRYSLYKSSDNNIFISSRFRNRILKITTDKKVRTVVNVSAPLPNNEFILSLAQNPNIAYTQDKYIIDIGNIYENNNMLMMRILKGMSYVLIISKTTNKEILINTIDDINYFGSSNFIGVADDKFISIFQKHSLPPDWKNKLERSTLKKHEKELLQNFKDEDNPILVLVEFNSF